MALVKCPECGQDVSSKAVACIHCGYPLQKPKNVISVRIVRLSRIVDRNFEIYDNESGELLETIKTGQIWTAELDTPRKLRFHLKGSIPGLEPKDLILDYIPNGIVKYEMELLKGLWRHSFVLNKADMISGTNSPLVDFVQSDL